MVPTQHNDGQEPWHASAAASTVHRQEQQQGPHRLSSGAALACQPHPQQPGPLTVCHKDQEDDERLHKRAPAALAAGQRDEQIHHRRHQQDLHTRGGASDGDK